MTERSEGVADEVGVAAQRPTERSEGVAAQWPNFRAERNRSAASGPLSQRPGTLGLGYDARDSNDAGDAHAHDD